MQDLNASTDGLDLPRQQPEKLKAATATPGPSQDAAGPSLIDRVRVEQEKNHLKRLKPGPPRPVGVPVMCRQPAFDHSLISTQPKVGHNPFVGPPSLRLYGSQSYVEHPAVVALGSEW